MEPLKDLLISIAANTAELNRTVAEAYDLIDLIIQWKRHEFNEG